MIEDKGAEYISEALSKNQILTTLNLRIIFNANKLILISIIYKSYYLLNNIEDNYIGKEGAKFIAEALKNNKALTTLNLGIIY